MGGDSVTPIHERPGALRQGPELAELDRFLQRFARGSRALQIEGPPGLGKTALWLEGIASARRRSCLVLTARPVEIETKLSFAGLADLLEPVLDDVLPELPRPQRRAFEAALLLAPARGLPDPRGVAAAFLGALRVLARDRVVLVAIDDLQWLDSSSIRSRRSLRAASARSPSASC